MNARKLQGQVLPLGYTLVSEEEEELGGASGGSPLQGTEPVSRLLPG